MTPRRLSIPAYIGLIALCIVVIFPIYWMLVVSLSPTGYSRSIGSVIPAVLTFDNFISLFTDRPMARWLTNSIIVALGSSVLAVLFGTSAGYALSRLRFRGSTLVMFVVLVTQMMPSTSIIVPLYALFRNLGLLNTLHGVGLAHMTLTVPLAIWMSKGFFDAIPVDLEGAARIDGCTHLGAFRHIALPLAAPGLAAILIYGFVTSWHEFLFARTLASPQHLWTAAVGLSSFRGEFFSMFEPQMAAAVVFALPVVIVFIVLQRQFVSGGMAGGVK